MTQSDNEVLCTECEEPINPERLKVIKTKICVNCMEELEATSKGLRYRMELDNVVSRDGSIEEMSFTLIKPKS